MSHAERQPILIKSSDDGACPGTLHITVYDKCDRVIQAAKVLGLYWGLALFSIFIPIAHLVLVPGFFLAGLIMVFLRYRVVSRSDQVTGKCPVNKNEITIHLEPSDRLPLWKYCPVCKAPLHLTDASGAPSSQ
jgi:hypothetical protein